MWKWKGLSHKHENLSNKNEAWEMATRVANTFYLFPSCWFLTYIFYFSVMGSMFFKLFHEYCLHCRSMALPSPVSTPQCAIRAGLFMFVTTYSSILLFLFSRNFISKICRQQTAYFEIFFLWKSRKTLPYKYTMSNL